MTIFIANMDVMWNDISSQISKRGDFKLDILWAFMKDLRKKVFTLSERAAIIFYIHYIQFLTGQKLELLYKEPTEIAEFDKKMNLISQKLYKLVLKL